MFEKFCLQTGIALVSSCCLMSAYTTQAYARPLSVDLATHPASQEWVQEHFGVAGHFLGEYFGGGVVFWVDPTSSTGNQHGLIADIKDRSGTYEWDTQSGGSTTGATGNSAYTGKNSPGGNTYIILHTIGATRGQAANACASSNAQGYTDWYLPSMAELETLFGAQMTVTQTALAHGGGGFFADTGYWSSTESSIADAYYYFSSFYGDLTTKSNAYSVRCVRAY